MVAIPDPATFQLMPARRRRVARDDLRRRHAGRAALRRRSAQRAPARARPYAHHGLRHLQRRPRARVLLFKDDQGTETLDEGGYFAMTTMDAASDLRHDTVKALESMGIPIEYAHHEVGPSQHEIDMRYASALDMADHTVTYRLVVKEIAKKVGLPRDLHAEAALRRERLRHAHPSVALLERKNAFFDADDEWHLSEVGKAFIAGQLHHAREISAVFAQWVNSYKRLVPGYEAPVYVAWSRRNRSALIRIPLYKPGNEQATRAEIRCPDPACNPYLTFALSSMRASRASRRATSSPSRWSRTSTSLTPEERKARHRRPPGDPRRGDRRARASDLAPKALGDHVFDRYVKLKRKEWDDYRVQLTPGRWRTTWACCKRCTRRMIPAGVAASREAGGLTDGRLRALSLEAARGRLRSLRGWAYRLPARREPAEGRLHLGQREGLHEMDDGRAGAACPRSEGRCSRRPRGGRLVVRGRLRSLDGRVRGLEDDRLDAAELRVVEHGVVAQPGDDAAVRSSRTSGWGSQMSTLPRPDHRPRRAECRLHLVWNAYEAQPDPRRGRRSRHPRVSSASSSRAPVTTSPRRRAARRPARVLRLSARSRPPRRLDAGARRLADARADPRPERGPGDDADRGGRGAREGPRPRRAARTTT